MPNSCRRALIATVLLLSLGACATQPLATDGSAVVGPNEGLMAVRFISNWKGNDSVWFEELSFGVRLNEASMNEYFEMRSADDTQLIPLPVGEYKWVQATIGSSYILFDTHSGFTITSGEITYVGDITLDIRQEPFLLITENFSVVDNRDETLAILRSDYGTMLDEYSVSVQISEISLSDR